MTLLSHNLKNKSAITQEKKDLLALCNQKKIILILIVRIKL